jgi:2-polyprenyl-6-methoxyphenol hydroxylase-like FAD-dependent oxidoreductase
MPTAEVPTMEAEPDNPASSLPEGIQTETTRCCVVGAGPAGVILALLLARQGIPVTLLEAHKDFDRAFRGDTIHPATLEVLDQLGLAEKVLALPHTKLTQVAFQSGSEVFPIADFRRLKTKFPYIALLPQVDFLNLIAAEAAQYPSFRLVMQAEAKELLEENGVYTGVRYRTPQATVDLKAHLTVAADGRFSRMRKAAGLEPVKQSPPMDVLWFRLSHKPDDRVAETFRIGAGHLLIVLNRGTYWQMGLIILKGDFPSVRQEGIAAFQQLVGTLAPEFADRTGELTDFKQITPLSVESSRLKQWYEPGLLFIGDAAHVMSPVGGVGINYAIQDAVEASNVLGAALEASRVTVRDLAKFQKRRNLPIKVIQAFQQFAQERIVKMALDGQQKFQLPLLARLPLLRKLPSRLIGIGLRRVRVER